MQASTACYTPFQCSGHAAGMVCIPRPKVYALVRCIVGVKVQAGRWEHRHSFCSHGFGMVWNAWCQGHMVPLHQLQPVLEHRACAAGCELRAQCS